MIINKKNEYILIYFLLFIYIVRVVCLRIFRENVNELL